MTNRGLGRHVHGAFEFGTAGRLPHSAINANSSIEKHPATALLKKVAINAVRTRSLWSFRGRGTHAVVGRLGRALSMNRGGECHLRSSNGYDASLLQGFDDCSDFLGG